VRKAAVHALRGFKVLSVTTNNGAEFRQHAEFPADLGAEIYYC
jgi:IS30 family transposase